VRLVLAGRQVRYDVTAVDDEEGVVTLRRYWRQRYRWARGHQQVCRDYRHCVIGSDRLTFGQRLESLSFLYSFHVPVAAAVGLLLLPLWLTGTVEPVLPQYTFLLWTVLFLGPLLELGAGLLLANASRREAFGLIWFLPLLLVSTALCGKAWIDGLLQRRYVWVKTQRAGDVVAT
jgi:cellulose synthase/poly-beta-1,6-N-acetylglucosamine synthase-like glycosyltransferase